jgi:hypothetical protein
VSVRGVFREQHCSGDENQQQSEERSTVVLKPVVRLPWKLRAVPTLQQDAHDGSGEIHYDEGVLSNCDASA